MKIFSRLIYVCLYIWVLLFIPHASVFAAGEFQADYDVQYAISPAGKTIVTQTITLTNKLANFYPKQYSLLVDSDRISSVIAYDDEGVITPIISVKEGRTDIILTFNAKNIGLGKISSFSLRYEHAGIASKNGNIWEVYIPGIANDPDIATYDVTLSVPPSFGSASYISPLPSKEQTWTKDQMISGGIAAAYGTEQYFDVSLIYELSNPLLTSQSIGLALPPDTAYQKVTVKRLHPKPETTERDKDGNWLAYYTLMPAQSFSVTADMQVRTYLYPRKDYFQPKINSSVYTQQRTYWETSDPDITALAASYRTPDAIYRYVSRILTYDYDRINAPTERLGARKALDAPNTALCTEFTDVFIAIARAAGMPARRNIGYAYTNNARLRPLSVESDVLHAWPEYYDRQNNIWIPIDPTWAHTTGGADYFSKLDFNHIVFAINGVDSSLPYPAGFYRKAETKTKNVHVDFSQSVSTLLPPKISISIEFPQQVGTGTSVRGQIIVHNEGGESAYLLPIDAQSDIGGIVIHEIIDELLPYATQKIPITAHIPQSLNKKTGTIHVQAYEASVSTSFTVQPMYILYGIVIAIACIILLLSVHLLRLLWKRLHKK